MSSKSTNGPLNPTERDGLSFDTTQAVYQQSNGKQLDVCRDSPSKDLAVWANDTETASDDTPGRSRKFSPDKIKGNLWSITISSNLWSLNIYTISEHMCLL